MIVALYMANYFQNPFNFILIKIIRFYFVAAFYKAKPRNVFSAP